MIKNFKFTPTLYRRLSILPPPPPPPTKKNKNKKKKNKQKQAQRRAATETAARKLIDSLLHSFDT